MALSGNLLPAAALVGTFAVSLFIVRLLRVGTAAEAKTEPPRGIQLLLLLGAFCMPLTIIRAVPLLTLSDMILGVVAVGGVLTRSPLSSMPMRIPAFAVVLVLVAVWTGTIDRTPLAGLLFAVLVLPTAVVAGARGAKSAVPTQFVAAYVAGSVVSGLVAVLQELRVVDFNRPRTPGLADRAQGLSVHPNHLALSLTLAVVCAAYYFFRGQRRGLNALALVIAAAGILVSGSRAPILSLAAILAYLTVIARVSIRRRLLTVALGLLLGALAVFNVDIIEAFFLERDLGDRGERIATSLQILAHNPLLGNGFDSLTVSHNILVQVAASAGLAGLFLWGLVVLLPFSRSTDQEAVFLARLLAIALLAFGMAQNQLTDRYAYLSLCLFMAVVATSSSASDRYEVSRPPSFDNLGAT